MDSFTERMLKRVEERRKVLDQKLAAAQLHNKNSSEEKSSDMPFAVKTPSKNNFMNDDNEHDSSCSDEESDCIENDEVVANEKENAVPHSSLRFEAKKRLKKLGALYSEDSNINISSPVQQTEQKFNESLSPSKSSAQSAALARRLAALAETINQREDDLRHITVKQPTVSNPAIVNRPWRCGVQGGSSSVVSKPTVVSVARKTNYGNTENKDAHKYVSSPTKPVVLDKSFLANLEAQGFARCESHSNLAFDYNKEKKNITERRPARDRVDQFGSSKSKGSATRERSPVKEIIETYNKIDETAEKESKVLSPTNKPATPKSPKKFESEQPKQRYGSPVKMGTGKSTTDVLRKQDSTTSIPAMGVRQLLSPHSSNQGSVLQKAALFEVAANNSGKKAQPDPAELPLSQRKALFEQNAGSAVLPKAPFALPIPPSMLQENKKPIMLPSASVNKISSSVLQKGNTIKSAEGPNKGLNNVVAMFEDSNHMPETSTKQHIQKGIEERQKELDMLKNRWNQHKNVNETTTSSPIPPPPPLPSMPPPPPPPIPNSQSHQRTVTFAKETIVNRFSYTTEDTFSTEDTYSNETDDSTFPSPPSPERDYPGLKNLKEIRVSPPKPGHLYPNLSDVENTESDIPQSDFDDFVSGMEDDRERFESSMDGSSMSEDSFGKQIMEVANRSLSQSTLRSLKRDLSMSSSTNSDLSDDSVPGNNDLDEFLDEALGESDSEPTPPKRGRSNNYDQNLISSHSQSFEYTQGNSHATNSTGTIPTYLVDGESHIPLTHTVSFYRKQAMNHKPVTPKKQVVHHSYREEDDEESSDEDICRQQEAVERRISELEKEVSCQQTVISQASQALNLCSSTIEFSGSTEEVEGERLLLVATQRRQAALHEIQRLKVEGTLRPHSRDNSKLTERGDLTLSNITLPLKLDNIRAAAREEKCFHLLCLVKSGPQVLPTTMRAAMPRNLHDNNKLTFPSTLTLNGLYSDFKVTVEVYGMSSRSKEVLPHDIKYHISTSKKDTCRLKLTPKKNKHDDKLIRPILQSPGGPCAVRTPKFSLMGYVVFSLREINRNHFTLNKVSYSSVLEGSIELHLSCQMSLDIEHRGFLTMFDDISGLGAWHRRWCMLKGDKLSYWKYPDDEKKKIPMDTIDLTTCITEEVGVVSRDICARPNTFLLETSRPARHDDEPSLILVRKGNQTIMRHLLSADTKDDRVEWCEHLNKALALLRAWGKK